MAQQFARWLGSEHDLPAGMFTRETDNGRCVMACPLCGVAFDMPPRCGPDQSGRSLYAIHCVSATCSWWDFAQFEAFWEEVLR